MSWKSSPQQECLFLVLAAFAIALCPLLAGAQNANPDMWIAYGSVFSIVQRGDIVYIGGEFDYVGPQTGCGAALDLVRGKPITPFPKVEGLVADAVSDSAGGWYIGGGFAAVGGVPRWRLAHVLSDGSVSDWNPEPNRYGMVWALALMGDTVFVAGSFNQMCGESRNNLAAIDARTGSAIPWNPGTNGLVTSLAVRGRTVYLGGRFTSVGGQSRNNLAAVDAATGRVIPWNPNAGHWIDVLAVNGGTIYAGGSFTSMGGEARNYLAALDAGTGSVTDWNPNPDDRVTTIAAADTTVYVGGDFTEIGGHPRNYIAAVDAVTGGATGWNPNANEAVRALALSGDRVYAGGYFTQIAGQLRPYVAGLDVKTASATDWNPVADTSVGTLVLGPGSIYAGGWFGSIGGETRYCVAAMDTRTGAATSWDPRADNTVYALAVRGSTVYAGGTFGRIGGQIRHAIAALDAATGNATPWDPDAGGPIFALATSGHAVYAGGDFIRIGGQPRNRIAALDVATGTATGWNPSASEAVLALAVSGTAVYAGGVFTSIGGQTREHVAALDAVTGAATTWNPGADDWVAALALSGKVVYAGGNFRLIGGQPRSCVGAVDAETGATTSWNPGLIYTGIIPPVLALAASGTAVYVGGTVTLPDFLSVYSVAAFDARTAKVLTWAPRTDFFVAAIRVNGATAYLGGYPIAATTEDTSFLALPAPTEGLQGLSLVTPSDAESLDTAQPTLMWTAARSADPAINVRYTVYWSERSDFVPADSAAVGPDTTYTFGHSVLRSTQTYQWKVRAFDRDSLTCWSSPHEGASFHVLKDDASASPVWFQIRPNPGQGNAHVAFRLPTGGNVMLRVFDVAGREVGQRMWESLYAGTYLQGWNAVGPAGRKLPSGAYWLRLETPAGMKTVRWTLVR